MLTHPHMFLQDPPSPGHGAPLPRVLARHAPCLEHGRYGELMLGIEITRLRAEQEGRATVGCHQQKQLICHQQVLYAVDYVDYVAT